MERVLERVRRIARIVQVDAAAWGIPRWAPGWLLALPIVATVGLALAAPHPRLYHFLVDEDHVIEWSQFVAILCAAGVFAVAGRRAYRGERRGLAIIFALVTVGSLVVAGEEISWGQRILGFGTPDALDTINHQGEANVHNISGVQRLFNLGELFAGLYGVVVPLLYAASSIRQRLAGRLDRLLVPPLCLGALFLLPFAYRAIRAVFILDAGERITEFGELPELTLYMGILITGVVIARRLGSSESATRA